MLRTICATPLGVIVRLDGVECRVWRAITDTGGMMDLYVHCVGSSDATAQEWLDQTLLPRPSPQEVS